MRYISRRKANALFILFLIEVVNLFLGWNYVTEGGTYTSDNIRLIAAITVFEVIITFVIWKKIVNEFCCPFFIVYVVSVIFGIGQCFCWTFGLDMGSMDLLEYLPKIPIHYIGNGLIYSQNAIIIFFLGALFAYSENESKKVMCEDTEANNCDYIAMETVSTLLLIISIPCVILNFKNVLTAVVAGGYSELYTELNSYSKAGQFIPLLAGWFPVALLMKYALYAKHDKVKSSISVAFLFIYIAINLFAGGRSGAVMLVLAFVLAKYYYGTPFTKKELVMVILGGYIFLGILNAIADTRLMSNRNFFSFFSSFSISSVLGDFIGEMGWSMSSTSWTMQLIDNGSYFRCGESYLYALTAIIPNLGFWKVHPAKIANLGDWLQSSLGRSTGLGYTFIAETYANFSWFGLILMFILGIGASRLLSKIPREYAVYNYRKSFLMVMIIATILKSFVRSSFSASMRPLVFTILLIYLMIHFVSSFYSGRRKEN